MGQGLSRSSYDARRHRPPRPSLDHLRDECRELSTPRRTRAQACSRTAGDASHSFHCGIIVYHRINMRIDRRPAGRARACFHEGDTHMKWLLTCMAAVAALVAGPANAADMPVKARPIAEAAYNWTGFYIGGTGGYNNGHLHWVYSSGSVPQQNPFELSNWNGGVFGGVQWQINQIVLGIEANGLWGDI